MLCNEVSHTTLNWNNMKNMKSFGSQLVTTGLTSQCTSTKTHSAKYCIIIILDKIPGNFAYVTPTASIRCSILTSIVMQVLQWDVRSRPTFSYRIQPHSLQPLPVLQQTHLTRYTRFIAKIYYVHFLIHLIILFAIENCFSVWATVSIVIIKNFIN